MRLQMHPVPCCYHHVRHWNNCIKFGIKSWFPHGPSFREKAALCLFRPGTEAALALHSQDFISELLSPPNSAAARITQTLALISAHSTMLSLLSVLLRPLQKVSLEQDCWEFYLPDTLNMPDPTSACCSSAFPQETLSNSKKLKLHEGKLSPTLSIFKKNLRSRADIPIFKNEY